MPPLPLQPIKDALAKATPGTWYHQRAMSDEESGQPGGTPDCVVTDGGEDERYNVFDMPTPEDCVAVVLLRNNAQALLDRIEELEKREEAYRQMAQEVEGMTFYDKEHFLEERDAILSKLKERLDV